MLSIEPGRPNKTIFFEFPRFVGPRKSRQAEGKLKPIRPDAGISTDFLRRLVGLILPLALYNGQVQFGQRGADVDSFW